MKNNNALERLEDLLDQATRLSDEEIESINAGESGESDIKRLADLSRYNQHPLCAAGGFDLNAPDLSLLRLFRNPDFFSFTCKHLFCKSDGSNQSLEIMPFQAVILRELWNHQFPMLLASRGAGKSFILAVYSLLRMTFIPGTKVVVIASSFRQSKIVFDYAAKLYQHSPLFRDLVGGSKRETGVEPGPRYHADKCSLILANGSELVAVPCGDGSKLRGLRSSCTIQEEFNSISPDVFERIAGGFGAVSTDPVNNVKSDKKKRALKKLEYWSKEMEEDFDKSKKTNQSIISGTAGYAFEIFGKYHSNYQKIIQCGGNTEALKQVMGGELIEGFDYKQYSIIRLPYTAIPTGYMDFGVVARARQMNNSAIFFSEYMACFAKDSDGFFRKTLINHATVGPNNPHPPVHVSAGEYLEFSPTLRGRSDRKYVFGIDPACERDNFAIVILEIWPEHRRVVYVWTTKKNDHRAKLKKKLVEDHDYFRYCARKIRDLMEVFPCQKIMMDAGGGGSSIREALRDPDKLKEGEIPVLEIIEEDKEKGDDFLTGNHILQMVQFRNLALISDANTGMKKDFEDQVLLFPLVDSITLALAQEQDVEEGRIEADGDSYNEVADTLETCGLEIENLKTELTTIIVTNTPSGGQKWDTPGKKVAGQVGVMRKDRYSALLIANMGARLDSRVVEMPQYDGSVGGFAGKGTSRPKSDKVGPAFRAPLLNNNPAAQAYFAAMYGE